jgi:hypothetical protein
VAVAVVLGLILSAVLIGTYGAAAFIR